MKKLMAVVGLYWICSMALPVYAQQVDVGMSGSTIMSGSANNLANLASYTPSERGGTFLGFNGDVLFHGNLGIGAEVNWRASQTLYAGQIPYRPLFWDFDAVYARRFSPRLGADLVAGIGAESIRFYTGNYQCDFYGNCSNYISSNHFMGVFGGGIKLYAWHNVFVRPEVRLYMIRNNNEFSSDFVARVGATVGYTFGGTH